jgi:hypothetical protein
MRWLVELTSIGKSDTQSICVEADSWQRALQAVRTSRGDTSPMSGFSIELLEDGYRAVDPMARLRYVVRKAEGDTPASLVAPPPSSVLPGALSSPAVSSPAVSSPSGASAPAVPSAAATSPSLASKEPPRPQASPPRPQPGKGAQTLAFSREASSGARASAIPPRAAPTNGGKAPSSPSLLSTPKAPSSPSLLSTPKAPSSPALPSSSPSAGAIPAKSSGQTELANKTIPETDPSIPIAEPVDEPSPHTIREATAPAPERAAPPAETSSQTIVDQEEASAVWLAELKLLSKREQDPTQQNALTYREYAFAAAKGISEIDAETLLRAQLERLKAHLGSARPGKLINLALFDQEFSGKPPVPPVATLSWKDWKDETQVAFPSQRSSKHPSSTRAPAASKAPSAPPPAAVSPSSPPLPPKNPSTLPPPPPVLNNAPVVHVPSAPPPFMPPAADVPATPPRPPAAANVPAAAAPAPFAAGPFAPPPAAAPNPFAPVAPAANPFAPAGAGAVPNPFAPSAPPANPFAPPPGPTANPFAPAAAVPPPAAAIPPPAAAIPPPAPAAPAPNPFAAAAAAFVPMASPDPFAPAPGTRASTAPPAPSVPVPTPRPASVPPATPSAQRLVDAGTISVRPSSGRFAAAASKGRVSGDELLSALFEAMHDLHFLRDTLDGAEFCLQLANDMLPCEAGIVHAFDVSRREFVVTSVHGAAPRPFLARRTADADPLLQAALRQRRAHVVVEARGTQAHALDRWRGLPELRSLIVAPVMWGGRAFGAIELANPLDGAPFSDGEGHALSYIAEQFVEFIGSHGLVIEPDKILSRAR